MRIAIGFKVNRDLTHLNVGTRIRNREGVKIYSWGTLNQDIDFWAQKKTDEIFWERSFRAGQVYEVIFDTEVCLGPNLYEIQASITEERDRYYGSQRMLNWKDEAAFFQVLMKTHEYFFGGVVDLEMRSSVRQEVGQ
jgi:lipopolysaccharide transport system ATP-binding protein